VRALPPQVACSFPDVVWQIVTDYRDLLWACVAPFRHEYEATLIDYFRAIAPLVDGVVVVLDPFTEIICAPVPSRLPCGCDWPGPHPARCPVQHPPNRPADIVAGSAASAYLGGIAASAGLSPKAVEIWVRDAPRGWARDGPRDYKPDGPRDYKPDGPLGYEPDGPRGDGSDRLLGYDYAAQMNLALRVLAARSRFFFELRTCEILVVDGTRGALFRETLGRVPPSAVSFGTGALGVLPFTGRSGTGGEWRAILHRMDFCADEWESRSAAHSRLLRMGATDLHLPAPTVSVTQFPLHPVPTDIHVIPTAVSVIQRARHPAQLHLDAGVLNEQLARLEERRDARDAVEADHTRFYLAGALVDTGQEAEASTVYEKLISAPVSPHYAYVACVRLLLRPWETLPSNPPLTPGVARSEETRPTAPEGASPSRSVCTPWTIPSQEALARALGVLIDSFTFDPRRTEAYNVVLSTLLALRGPRPSPFFPTDVSAMGRLDRMLARIAALADLFVELVDLPDPCLCRLVWKAGREPADPAVSFLLDPGASDAFLFYLSRLWQSHPRLAFAAGNALMLKSDESRSPILRAAAAICNTLAPSLFPGQPVPRHIADLLQLNPHPF
jgi:hypothetical protein